MMSELRSEAFDNFRNCSCNHIQQKADWFTKYYVTTIGERYKRADLHIHGHIRCGLSEFCAIFQYTEGPPNEGIVSLSPPSGSKPTSFDSCNLDNPMLVSIVNLFQPKEGAIASTPFGHKNRKLEPCVLCNCFRFIQTVQEGKLIDEIIKGRTKVVSNFSNINTPIKRRWGSVYFDSIDILARLKILLCTDDTIMSIFEEGILHQT